MRSVNNHKMMLISGQAHEADYPADGTLFTDALTAGVVAVVGADGKVETGATSGDYFWLAQSQGSGLPIIKSGAILKSTVKVYSKAYAAAAAQVDYIGYNASTNAGSLAFTADEAILVRASLKTNFAQFQDKEVHVLGDHTPTSTSTEATVALALAKSLVQNSEKFVNVPFQVDRVSSATGAANTSATGTITFTKGSKTVTCSGGTPSTDYAVGGYIRFGTADTAAVYKLTAVDDTGNGTLTLDLAYQGASGTLTATNAYIITAAQATAGTFGIKLTGKAKKFSPGKFRYESNKWITTVAGMGATAVANVTVATEGTGTYGQVAEDEWAYQILGEDIHNGALIQVGPVTMRSNVAAAGTYDVIHLNWSEPSGGTDIIGNPTAHKSIVIALDSRTTAYSASALKTAIELNDPS